MLRQCLLIMLSEQISFLNLLASVTWKSKQFILQRILEITVSSWQASFLNTAAWAKHTTFQLGAVLIQQRLPLHKAWYLEHWLTTLTPSAKDWLTYERLLFCN